MALPGRMKTKGTIPRWGFWFFVLFFNGGMHPLKWKTEGPFAVAVGDMQSQARLRPGHCFSDDFRSHYAAVSLPWSVLWRGKGI